MGFPIPKRFNFPGLRAWFYKLKLSAPSSETAFETDGSIQGLTYKVPTYGDIMSFSGGSTPQYVNIGQSAYPALAGYLIPCAANQFGTPGSGTGVTVNRYPATRSLCLKITCTYQAFAAAALTADKVLWTTPAMFHITSFLADVTTPFSGGAVSAATMTAGITAGGNELMLSQDVKTAAALFGDDNAEQGADVNQYNGKFYTPAQAIQARLTTVTANTNALTVGSVTFYILGELL